MFKGTVSVISRDPIHAKTEMPDLQLQCCLINFELGYYRYPCFCFFKLFIFI